MYIKYNITKQNVLWTDKKKELVVKYRESIKEIFDSF